MKAFLGKLPVAAKAFLLVLGTVAAVLGILTFAEYRPADRETLIEDHEVEKVLETGVPMTLVSLNCGYGALGDNADFFMDGGTSVRTASRERVERNLAGILEFLQGLGADILLLQEVDASSGRSFRIDQREVLGKALPGASRAFALNHSALFIPYPLPPIGHVEAGLLTLSRAPMREAERVALPCPFSWPVRCFNLKRCMLVSRYPVKGTDRELVVINLHLEAYDEGEGKEAQTRALVSLMKAEAEKGSYVIAGGDFNQMFTHVDPGAFPYREGTWMPGRLSPEQFGDGFALAADSSCPSCRSLNRPIAGADWDSFQFYLIDGFAVSRNVEVQQVETVNEGFVFTDHNPVRLRCTLKAQEDG